MKDKLNDEIDMTKDYLLLLNTLGVNLTPFNLIEFLQKYGLK